MLCLLSHLLVQEVYTR